MSRSRIAAVAIFVLALVVLAVIYFTLDPTLVGPAEGELGAPEVADEQEGLGG